jgi:hypothetical protein
MSEALLPFVPLMKGGQPELKQGAQRLSKIVDEVKRREVGAHFVLLGGLRYNQPDLLKLAVRDGMILLEQFKASSTYEFFSAEAWKEGLEGRLEGKSGNSG